MTIEPNLPDRGEVPSHPDALHPAVPADQSPPVYGVFLRPQQHRFPIPARVLFLVVMVGGGLAAWLVAQTHELLPADSVATPAVLAGWLALVGAAYYLLTRSGGEVGIEVGPEMVRFGRWPDGITELHRADLASADLSPRAWDGGPVEPALRSFLVRGFRYLTLRRKDGVVFQVAVDSANPFADRIVDVLTDRIPLQRPSPPEESEPIDDSDSADHDPPAVESPTVEPPTVEPHESAAEAEERLWEAANRRHDEVLRAYLPYEVDPHLLMAYPTITDVTVDATAAFLDALGEAATLRTDAFPTSLATSVAYRDRVKALGVAWSRAERNAKRVGISQLDDGQQRKIRQAARLLRHAEGADNPFEQASYLQQVSKLIDELTREGAITPPPRIAAEITSRASLALENTGGEEAEPG